MMDHGDSPDDMGQAFLSDQYVLQDDLDGLDDTADNTDDSSHGGRDKLGLPLREQDRFLPIANIAKIMKRAIPENGKMIQNKIAKDARECVQECVSEFISFITSEASDRCQMEKRKTINGEDILFAMTTLGFDNYMEPLKLYLQKYREVAFNAAKGEKCYSPELTYEEINEDYSAGSSGTMLAGDNNQQETVIYTYQEVDQLQHAFSLN